MLCIRSPGSFGTPVTGSSWFRQRRPLDSIKMRGGSPRQPIQQRVCFGAGMSGVSRGLRSAPRWWGFLRSAFRLSRDQRRCVANAKTVCLATVSTYRWLWHFSACCQVSWVWRYHDRCLTSRSASCRSVWLARYGNQAACRCSLVCFLATRWCTPCSGRCLDHCQSLQMCGSWPPPGWLPCQCGTSKLLLRGQSAEARHVIN